MARGGKRDGAGRKQGSLNKSTVERLAIVQEARAAGRTPLDLMLGNMLFAATEADKLKRKIKRRGIGDRADLEALLKVLDAAQRYACDAAPYVHPKLAAVAHTGDANNPMLLTHEVVWRVVDAAKGN